MAPDVATGWTGHKAGRVKAFSMSEKKKSKPGRGTRLALDWKSDALICQVSNGRF
jgi:hypothetical protein